MRRKKPTSDPKRRRASPEHIVLGMRALRKEQEEEAISLVEWLKSKPPEYHVNLWLAEKLVAYCARDKEAWEWLKALRSGLDRRAQPS